MVCVVIGLGLGMLRLQETSPISIAIALYSYFKSSKNHIHIRGRENQRTEHLACSHYDGGLSKLVGPFHVLLADDAVVWERALSPQQMEALALLQLAIAIRAGAGGNDSC